MQYRGNTAVEIIYNRADHKKEHMGLTSWEGAPNEKLGKELEILRNDGKMKTTKFRELLGKKLVYSMILTIFKRYNLLEEPSEKEENKK